MGIFTGTAGGDLILRESLSAGVVTDPPDLTGTLGNSNIIDAGGGDDVVEAGDNGDDISGGAGRDLLIGGLGPDLLKGNGGADRMLGGEGSDIYTVDNAGDFVFDDGAPDLSFDIVFANASYSLSETGGVEGLWLGEAFYGVPATPRAIYGGGNSVANVIVGNQYANVLDGKGGDDLVEGFAGNDCVLGGKGNDDVQGDEGNDVVRGQDGDDYNIWGGSGRDMLIGGRGDDTFFFNYATDSGLSGIDVIKAGDGAAAFEGAGSAAGDLIWLPNSISFDEPIDFSTWIFGGTGEGHVSCVEAEDRRTLVRGNMDDDPAFEFKVLIDDGNVRASAYTAADFFLG